ncbi:MAG: hypothetical protein GY757_43460 [bacterium]|nr:hypothetical protein [bacterium]
MISKKIIDFPFFSTPLLQFYYFIIFTKDDKPKRIIVKAHLTKIAFLVGFIYVIL